MVAKLLNLLSWLQKVYDMMKMYSKTSWSSEGMKLVYCINLENDAKARRQKTTIKVNASLFNENRSKMDNFT